MALRSRHPRTPLLCAATTGAAIAFLTGCSSGGFEGTVRCRGAVAEVLYDPDERVEVEAQEARVGWADAGGRGLNGEACERVATQDSWGVEFEYERTTRPIRLRCSFPNDFFVHVHPSFSSESGEAFSDGSALYLVAEEGRNIVASASLREDSKNSSLQFSERYCTPQ